MRTLLNKIRKLLKDKRTRRFWSRTVSFVAALVVFVTTYALVLPAITMERQAYCGLEAHQHTDDCFERQLVCTIPESPGHHHDESCYTMRQEYSCTLEEHVHEEWCYDGEGNLICEIPEHTHEEGTCWQEVPELTCTLEESDGHQHGDACYENVLVCGKEVHTHSEACYENPDELLETAAVATTQDGAYGISSGEGFDGSDADSSGDTNGSGDEIGWTDSDEYGNAARSDTALSDDPSTGLTDSDNAANSINAAGADADGSETADADALGEEAQQDLTSGGISEEEDRYVPQLDPLAFDTALNKHTGIYYYHVREGETVEDSSLITEWEKVEKNTELGPNDLLRVYLSYTIPAGSLNETNPTAVYRLPASLHLTDDQVNGINAIENGIAAAYIDYNTLTVTDPDNYHRYLGAEAIEGTRTPDQTLAEYLAQSAGGSGGNDSSGTGNGNAAGQEFISATVRVQNVYDNEGLYGEKGAYLGQDLIFTFSPYTIEKNQHTYDASGQPTSAGQKVRGWFALDFNLTQVDWGEPYIEEVETIDNIENIEAESNRGNENAGENTGDENTAVSDDGGDTTVLVSREFRTANIVFVEKDASRNLDEISASIKVVTAENYERVEANPDDVENIENVENSEDNDEDNGEENGEEQPEENAEGIEEDLTGQEAGSEEDASSADSEDKSDADAPIMPAISFEDSIRVRTGKPAGVEDGSAGSAAASAAEALPRKAKVTVRVEADEGTFPAGTTMVLSAVEDLDAVAETVKETVENGNSEDNRNAAETEEKNSKTYGFQAVDISFRDADGNEIEPVKPVRVALTSEIVEQIKADKEVNANTSIADPVVVHLDDDGNVQKMDLIAPDEIKPAQGKSEEELLEEREKTAAETPEETVEKTVEGTTADEQTGTETMEEASGQAGTEAEEAGEGAVEQAGTEAAEAADGDDGQAGTEEDENNSRPAGKEEPGETEVDAEPGTTGEEAVFFETESFSVYAIVYTVDFHYEVNGRVYEFSIPGGGYISMEQMVEVLGIANKAADRENEEGNDAENAENSLEGFDLNDLEVSEATKRFVEDITSVAFSRPDLVWVGKVEESTTVGTIKVENELEVEYSAALTIRQINGLNEKEVQAGDWILISLHPFESTEELTVTMKNGEVWRVRTTDAQNAVMNPDGETVQTIPNPSGTTIMMFDYWVNDSYKNETARRAWPGYSRNGTTGIDASFWNNFTNKKDGDNSGINSGHKLKFSPSMSGTVTDYNVSDGNSAGDSTDGNVNTINGWNGYNQNNTNYYTGRPTTGIVAGALYNSSGQLDENGYPRLGWTGGESLSYLFNPNQSNAGKGSYTYADNLFYVDPEGYYTYDSMDYKATMDKSTAQFTVRKQPADNGTEGINGFWPMGDLNYWFGMHLQSQFSIPANGEVLNPRGEYKPMQFEFSGDDDAWAYVDGILVADGGGIHNRTELDINFKTGRVLVKGGTYTDLSNPNTDIISSRTLYEIFLGAYNSGLMSAAKWNSYRWEDVNGDGTPDTFAAGTYHTFDFFYLERGGGESNLYIRYNLVSTEDFTAHKAVDGLTGEERLARDAYQFELIGLGDEYIPGTSTVNGVIMPKEGWHIENGSIVGTKTEGAGTFTDPKMIYSSSAYTDSQGTMQGGYILTTGVSENGDIRFGMADINPQLLQNDPYEHKYIIREVVPDDAMNAEGVTWAKASAAQRAAGGFVKDNVYYDGRVIYMKGTITSWNNSTEHGLSKTYYTDDTFSVVDNTMSFVDFRNKYMEPLALKVTKKDQEDHTLQGVEFTLTRAHYDTDNQKWLPVEETEPAVQTTNAQGVIRFEDLTLGSYILEESRGLRGYKDAQNKWLVTLTKQERQATVSGETVTLYDLKPSVLKINLDGSVIEGETATVKEVIDHTFEQQVLNEELQKGDIVVRKTWLQADGTPYADLSQTGADLSKIKIEGDLYRSCTVNTGDPVVRLYMKTSRPGASWETVNGDLYFTGTVKKNTPISFSVGIPSSGGWETNMGYTVTSDGTVLTAVQGTGSITLTNKDGSTRSRNNPNVYTLNVTQDTDIYVTFGLDAQGNSPQFSDSDKQQRVLNYTNFSYYVYPYTEGTSSGQTATTEEFIEHFTLNSDSWSRVWSDLTETDGAIYTYYLENVKEYIKNDQDQWIEGAPENFSFYPSLNPATDQSNGDLVFALKNQRTGEETEMIVRKVWVDNADHSAESIRYKIQRVEYDASGTLTSGPYDYIAAGQSSVTIYTLGSTDTYDDIAWQKHHANLPADNGVDPAEEGYREYRYSVLETSARANYTTDYEEITENGQTIKVIRNTPSDGKLSVEKKWLAADGVTELTSGIPEGAFITGTLNRTYPRASGVTVNVYFRTWSGAAVNEMHLYQSYPNIRPGSTFSLWAVDANGKEPNNGVSVNGTSLQQNGAERTFVISSTLSKTSKAFVTTVTGAAGDTVSIICDWQFNTGYNTGIYYQADYDQVQASSQTNSETVGEFRLDAANGWSRMWTSGTLNETDGRDYTYSLANIQEHLADGTVVGYYDGFLAPTVGAFTAGRDGKLEVAISNVQTRLSIKIKKMIVNTETALPEAGFTLTQVDENGHNVTGGIVQGPAETDMNGEITFEGLVPGCYKLDETQIPEGYNRLEGPYFINVTADGNDTVDGTVQYIHYQKTGEDHVYTVENTPGAALPAAGGPGTRLYLLLGGALAAIAGAMLVRRRRI